MAYKRKRPYTGRNRMPVRAFKRRRPYRLGKRSFAKGKPRGRGYQKRYNQKVFRGSSKLTASKVARCIETKIFFGGVHASSTAINAASASAVTLPELTNVGDKIYMIQPMAGMTQATTVAGIATDNYHFNGECIWLTGISIEFFASQATNDQYRLRVMAYKVNQEPNFRTSYGGNVWLESREGSTVGPPQKHFQFFDMPYPVANDVDMFVNRKNPNCGSKCLYDKTYTIGNPLYQATANSSYFKKIKVWLPINQMFRWKDTTATSLTAVPNFGAYGDYYFCLYWVTGSDVIGSGPTPGLGVGGLNYRVYFKDP